MAQEGTAAAEERTAPEPDADHKPESPTDIKPPGWRYTAKSAFAEFQRDQCTDLAAALTYYSVLSVFPALLALVSLLGVFGQGAATTEAILDILRRLGQEQIAEQLEEPIAAMVGSQSAGVALVIGLVVALWSASGYVGAFGRSLNRIYQVDEGRPVWKLRPVVFAHHARARRHGGHRPRRPHGQRPDRPGDRRRHRVRRGELPALGPRQGPDHPRRSSSSWSRCSTTRRRTSGSRSSGGSRWARPSRSAIWVLASLGFGFYVSNISRYNALYGSLGGVIVFLLWLWITNLALLFGAEVDAELERARELQAGIRAERRLQLPPRDATASVKAAEKLEERVAEGRRLRLAAEAAAGAGGAAGRGWRRARPGMEQGVPTPRTDTEERASRTSSSNPSPPRPPADSAADPGGSPHPRRRSTSQVGMGFRGPRRT